MQLGVGRNRGEKIQEQGKREQSFNNDAGGCSSAENRLLEKRSKKWEDNYWRLHLRHNGTILEKVMVSQELK